MSRTTYTPASQSTTAVKAPTRISHIDFTDLHYDPEHLTAQRALTRCELIILRVRDKAGLLSEDEKLLLSLISDETHKLLVLTVQAQGYDK